MKSHTRHLLEMIRKTVGPAPTMGAEIGVFRGENAQHIQDVFPKCHLILVDEWKAAEPDSPYWKYHSDMGKLSPERWKAVEKEAWERCFRVDRDITWMKMTSLEAAAIVRVRQMPLDFVFIDATHLYEAVKADIEAWAPLVRPGGLISGHDYSRRCRGVIKAVNEAFAGREIMVNTRWKLWGVVAQ